MSISKFLTRSVYLDMNFSLYSGVTLDLSPLPCHYRLPAPAFASLSPANFFVNYCLLQSFFPLIPIAVVLAARPFYRARVQTAVTPVHLSFRCLAHRGGDDVRGVVRSIATSAFAVDCGCVERPRRG